MYGWRHSDHSLRASALSAQTVALVAVGCLAAVAKAGLPLSPLYVVKVCGVFATTMVIAVGGLREHHPFRTFGAANQITTARAALVALLAGLIGEPGLPIVAWVAASASLVAAALDGADGWLARRTRMASAFGARFDMEIDAALVQVLAVLAWQYGKAGPWVLVSGLLRYGFVASGWLWPWMRRPLFASARRKTICVIQIVGLIVTIVPVITPRASAVVAAFALAILCYSFLVDTMWLHQNRHQPGPMIRDRLPRVIVLCAALVLLNVSVSFDNVWPTPFITWRGELSIELALFILGLTVSNRWFGPPSKAALGWLTACWAVLVIGRYGTVTAPALFGREINLYWDLRFVPDVMAMVTRVAPLWLIVVAGSAAALTLMLFFGILRWALGRLADAVADAHGRRALAVASFAAIMLFVIHHATGAPARPAFAVPVTHTYARQLQLVATALVGSKSLAASPTIDSDLTRVKGADVFLIFIESYGAATYDRRELAGALRARRLQFESAIRETNRDVVSAYVESPTFGGSSWLAHLSLLSGIEVRDPDTNALLMMQRRDTLVKLFSRRGFRTVALMPGLRKSWPEGAFYGFDEIYNADRLAYRGPQFGWFAIPDQFSLDRLDALEVARQSRPPLFVFFPTISTHFPFSPIPPYQTDWRRMLTDHPYDARDVDNAYSTQPDWKHFGPDYVAAVSYAFTSIGGYLRARPNRDCVLILVGDHQPAAAVSGDGAPWDVPVHIIASRERLLEAFVARGFQPGLTPARPALGRMHTLLPVLLDAFGNNHAHSSAGDGL